MQRLDTSPRQSLRAASTQLPSGVLSRLGPGKLGGAASRGVQSYLPEDPDNPSQRTVRVLGTGA